MLFKSSESNQRVIPDSSGLFEGFMFKASRFFLLSMITDIMDRRRRNMQVNVVIAFWPLSTP